MLASRIDDLAFDEEGPPGGEDAQRPYALESRWQLEGGGGSCGKAAAQKLWRLHGRDVDRSAPSHEVAASALLEERFELQSLRWSRKGHQRPHELESVGVAERTSQNRPDDLA